MKNHFRVLSLVLALSVPNSLQSQGKVYLVLGSDTAIWDGMDVASYHCTYDLGLFADPLRNAAQVMAPSFRAGLTDSYGTPVKLTWWMMQGNIYRFATNTNVPHANSMTLHLMKQYNADAIRNWGDELTLHYHTFVWTDYDNDGTWYWNQAKSFAESSDDYDVTLAEMLLEEETFPVSFRSGWHAMDNGWQQRLDALLPFCMHNDWPAKHTDPVEPIDNEYDWSRATSAFVPFHPSPTDYQVSGSCRGWNLRSMYMSGADSTFMAQVFAAAASGTDQIVCLWAHLPETDYLQNVEKVNRSAHLVAPHYPAIPFRYCTAVEAMQAWRHTTDTTRPVVTITEIAAGENLRWHVSVNESVFQPLPFVALKDRYERYRLLTCEKLSEGEWTTSELIPRSLVAKVGAALTDTSGNCGIAILRYLPDDVFVDDASPGYVELQGNWSAAASPAWGRTSRVASLVPGDTARVRWTPPALQPALYSIFCQVPAVSSPAQHIHVRLLEHGSAVDSIVFTGGIVAKNWQYLTTRFLSDTSGHALEMSVEGDAVAGMQLPADVFKYTPLVRERWCVPPVLVDLGELVVDETATRNMLVRNAGIQRLAITGISSRGGSIVAVAEFPLTIPAMENAQIDLHASPNRTGPLADSLDVYSDDPVHPHIVVPVQGTVRDYYALVDDQDSLSYMETGTWAFSTAHAYATTSRYAYPAPGVSATFATILKKEGRYRVEFIVPTTVNASTRACYRLQVGGATVDSVFLDQNTGSGAWVTLFTREVTAATEARVVITDAMNPVVSGKVLRADAIRWQWIFPTAAVDQVLAGLPQSYGLGQNFPNPFNPTTAISYQLSAASKTTIAIYDMLGREVAVLVEGVKAPGVYTVTWDAMGFASGVYICRMTAGDFVAERKMVLVR